MSTTRTKEQILAEIQLRRRREEPLTGVWRENRELYRAAEQRFGGWHKAIAAAGFGISWRQLWTKELVLDAIQCLHESGVSVRLIRHQRLDLISAACTHFGTWGAAVAAAGIDATRYRRWSKEQVIQALRHCCRFGPVKIGREDPPLARIAGRLFGSLDQALEAAGLESVPGRWTQRRIVATIQDGYVQGLPLGRPGFGKANFAAAVKRRFGSWHAGVAAAGLASRLPPRVPFLHWTKESVLEALLRHVTQGGQVCKVWRDNSKLYNAAKRHFGDWKSALAAAGLKSERRSWTSDLVLQLLRFRHCQGLGTSFEVIKREDSGLIAAAVKYFGRWRAALEAAGIDAQAGRGARRHQPGKPSRPRVRHISPVRSTGRQVRGLAS